MNHTMHGIIFSYGKPTGLGDLIAHRIPGSMPFGGNYRVVDFMLSSMVNAGIHDVGVIMHGKCQLWVVRELWEMIHLYPILPML